MSEVRTSSATGGPGQLYTGGTVLTMEPTRPRADAVAVHAGRIVAVGGEDECRAALRERTRDVERVDLDGGCLVPGFIDTHLHPIGMVYYEMNADLRDVASIAELQARLRETAARTAQTPAVGAAASPSGSVPAGTSASAAPAAGTVPAVSWIVGLQLDDEALAERRLPTRHELDAACADRPVVLMERDSHTAIGNTCALAAAGITAATPDPPGGHVVREADGSPAGPCHEAAARLLFGAVPMPGLDALRDAARRCFRRVASHGITSIGAVLQTDDEGPAGEAGRFDLAAMELLLEHAPFAVYGILVGRDVDAVVAARGAGGALDAPEAGRRIGGFKIFADGTFGSCTACMAQPFADRPDRSGYMTLADEEIYGRMERAHAAGLQICVHAIGDAANERCVALFERLLAAHPRPDHRHRIEHASLLAPALIGRIARLGIAVSTQPLFIASERGWLHKRLGAERARHVYPLRALLDAGVLVGGASDAPVESTHVLRAIECCVTRDGFETQQSITAEEALRLFTIDAARVQREEAEKGSLAPGKRADLALLDADPLAVPAERIGTIRVRRTVVAGRTIHEETR